MEIETIPSEVIPPKVHVKFGRGDCQAFVSESGYDGRWLLHLTLSQANALIEALSKAVVGAQRQSQRGLD